MARAQDRRVRRTERLLRAALLELIRERGFEALSVQDIIDRANVGRATFYAHFDNKEHLLVSGFEELRASLKVRQREALAGSGAVGERALAFSREMFAHTDRHRDLFRAMVGKKSGVVVQQVIHKLVIDLVREEVKAPAPRDAGALPTETLVQFMAGGFFGLITWWLTAKSRPSVDEIDAHFRRLAVPAFEAGLRTRRARTEGE